MQLREIMRELEALIDTRTACKNRRGHCQTAAVQASLHQQIAALDAQIDQLEAAALELVRAHNTLAINLKLLCTIKGVAERTALRVLAELAGKQFTDARQLAAYAGLTPRQHQSGDTVKGRTHLCKIGNARLRNALYLPAQSARRWCPPIKRWADDLQQRLTPKAVTGAVMRKLAHIIFGILKHQQPFDPNRAAIPQLSI